MMDPEPSVLDFVKAWLRGKRMKFPEQSVGEEGGSVNPEQLIVSEPDEVVEAVRLPWRTLLALVLALVAQFSLEPRPNRTSLWGVLGYLAAGLFVLWGWLAKEFDLAAHLKMNFAWKQAEQPLDEKSGRMSVRQMMWIAGTVFFSALALIAFGNRVTGQYVFNATNLLLWAAALFCAIRAFWQQGESGPGTWLRRIWWKMRRGEWTVHFSWQTILWLAVLGLGIFFRFYRLESVPSQMVSDHAEKLLDVYDVLNGQYNTYFPRNTGREFFQFYWTALMVLLFGQGVSFLSLKLGTVILGVLTLPYLYLIGKELGSKRVGLLAMGFAGIAYWPNLISRIALRFTLYPFFYAPTLYYFLRGMRLKRRSDFIWSGIFLGLGLHGYSPSRMVPILLTIGVVLYWLHARRLAKEAAQAEQSESSPMSVQLAAAEARRSAGLGLVAIALVSFVLFLPLLRYTMDNPQMVAFRALTRLGDVEQPLQGNPWTIFLSNLWRGLTMFAWDNGEVWVISITHRPILDVVSAALFHLGAFLLLVRYLRQRHWVDLFMLLSVPVLLMPSILSLAFPGENPCLNRTAAAIIPTFLFVGYALDAVMVAFERAHMLWGKRFAWGLAALLLLLSSLQNYDMVFNQYAKVYDASSWNTSEMGDVARAFADSVGSVDTTYLVAYPYWADSRLVGIAAGYPTKDYALWPEHFQDTLLDTRAKLFIINPNDMEDVVALRALYPQGVLYNYDSPVEGKDFLLFFVPPTLVTQP
jgi:hypothetical protein